MVGQMKLRMAVRPDPYVLVLSWLISILGILIVFDAGYARSLEKGTLIPREVIVQFFALLIGAFLGLCVRQAKPETVKKVGYWSFYASLVVVALMYAFHFGIERNGAVRWIGWRDKVEIQPAEFVKLTAILFLAGALSNRKAWPTRKFKSFALWLDNVPIAKLKRCWPGIAVLIAVLAIVEEPDMGTGGIIALTAIAMFVLAGVHWKTLLIGFVIGVVGVVYMVHKQPYRMDRITDHNSRWSAVNRDNSGYQTTQSEVAEASGGVFGAGIGSGRAKHVMPAATTDFVSTTIAEELALVGIYFVLALIGVLVGRLYYLARRSDSQFSALVILGVATWFGVQASINIWQASGLIWAVGIPLPFISYGGSSMVALWLALGVCHGLVAHQPKKETVRETDSNRWRDSRTRLSGV